MAVPENRVNIGIDASLPTAASGSASAGVVSPKPSINVGKI